MIRSLRDIIQGRRYCRGMCRRLRTNLIPLLVLCWQAWPAAADVRRMDLSFHPRRQQSLGREASRDHINNVLNWAAADGLILWTLANYGWREFVYNWVATVRRAEIENFFIAALDDRLLAELKDNDIPCVKLHNALGAGTLEWGTEAFKERGREKIRFISMMLEAGLSPIFSDLDVAWLRNPMPYVRQFPEANVLISSDTWTVSISDPNALDDCPSIMGADRTVAAHGTFVGKMNVGVHMLRPSAIGFVEAWLEEMVSTSEMEQLSWNAVMMRNMDEQRGSQPADKYCRSMEGRIVAGLLPASLFENGLNFFVQQLPAKLGVSPFVVHESFIAGAFAKIYHLREALLWHVDPVERFSPDVKLLSVELGLGEKVMREAGLPAGLDRYVTEQDAQGHLELAKQQYIQVRAAAALAKALNRSLVMPQLWCGLENLWSPHGGRSWGNSSEHQPPAKCAMSQLFHLERWEKEAGVRQTLPPLLESSFFNNQHTKIEHGEVLHVTACRNAGDKLCCRDVEACELQLQRLEILEGMKKDDVLAILQATKEVRLLKLSQAHKLLPDEYILEDRIFFRAFEAARRDWCCTDKGSTLAVPLSPMAEERSETGLAPDSISS